MTLYIDYYSEDAARGYNTLIFSVKLLGIPQSTNMYKFIYSMEYLISLLIEKTYATVVCDENPNKDFSIISHYFDSENTNKVYLMGRQFDVSNTPKIMSNCV